MFKTIADNRLTENDVTLNNLTSISRDARKIDARDGSFDVICSNSEIEHEGVTENQRQMGREVQRVGKRYFVQTPNRYFPPEPYFIFPFFQFLPLKIRVWLLRNFKLGLFEKTPDEVTAREIVESIRLLNKRGFFSMFPTAANYEEKILGLTKSFVAYGGWDER